jgi:membrane protease YdiL (CAAX protease family)
VYGSTWALKVSLQSAAAAGSSRAVYVFLFGTVWAPTAAALLVSWLTDGRRGCAQLLRRVFSWPRGAGWFIVAAVTPAAAVGLAIAIARFFGDAAPRPPLSLWPSIIGLQVVTGATGEELGWRGFLVPVLARRMTFARAAILSALLWSGWHVAGILFPGMGPAAAPLPPFLSLVAMFGIFLAIVFVRTGHVLAPILAHLSMNATLALAGTPITSPVFWWTLTIAIGGCAAFIHLFVDPPRSADRRRA